MDNRPAENQGNQQHATSLGSPRKLKPTLDIDAALYIQSQAKDVQERNNQRQQQQQYSALPSPAGGRGWLANNSCSSNNRRLNFNFQQNTNISVDYIDCLSNVDLVAAHRISSGAATSLVDDQCGATNQAANMRGIPSCRKHFQRFHRNRVEPRQQPHQAQVEPRSSLESATKEQPSNTSSSELSSVVELQQQAAQQQSVLYPISISEVKKRTYFIGSMGQDSLLGEDELYRYFPNGRVSIFVCTWNQNRKRAPANLNDLLLPNQLVYLPDIYAIGIQEAFSSQQDYLRDWSEEDAGSTAKTLHKLTESLLQSARAKAAGTITTHTP